MSIMTELEKNLKPATETNEAKHDVILAKLINFAKKDDTTENALRAEIGKNAEFLAEGDEEIILENNADYHRRVNREKELQSKLNAAEEAQRKAEEAQKAAEAAQAKPEQPKEPKKPKQPKEEPKEPKQPKEEPKQPKEESQVAEATRKAEEAQKAQAKAEAAQKAAEAAERAAAETQAKAEEATRKAEESKQAAEAAQRAAEATQARAEEAQKAAEATQKRVEVAMKKPEVNVSTKTAIDAAKIVPYVDSKAILEIKYPGMTVDGFLPYFDGLVVESKSDLEALAKYRRKVNLVPYRKLGTARIPARKSADEVSIAVIEDILDAMPEL